MGEQVMRLNTLCPDCEGRGEIAVSYGMVSVRDQDLPAGTAFVTRTCRTCGGDGKLKGFQPPV